MSSNLGSYSVKPQIERHKPSKRERWARMTHCWCRDLCYIDHLTRKIHVRNTTP